MERPTSLDLEEKQERDYNCLQRPHRRTDPRRTELHSDDDALSEETPLLGNGTRNVVPDGKQDSWVYLLYFVQIRKLVERARRLNSQKLSAHQQFDRPRDVLASCVHELRNVLSFFLL